MIEDLQKMLKEIPEQRSLILDKLVEFSLTDMMLFWGQNKELVAQQEKIWGPLLQWVEQEFDTKLKTTQNLDVPEQDQKLAYRLNFELQKLSDRQSGPWHPGSINGQCAHRLRRTGETIWRQSGDDSRSSRENEAGGDHYRGAY